MGTPRTPARLADGLGAEGAPSSQVFLVIGKKPRLDSPQNPVSIKKGDSIGSPAPSDFEGFGDHLERGPEAS